MIASTQMIDAIEALAGLLTLGEDVEPNDDIDVLVRYGQENLAEHANVPSLRGDLERVRALAGAFFRRFGLIAVDPALVGPCLEAKGEGWQCSACYDSCEPGNDTCRVCDAKLDLADSVLAQIGPKQ